MDAMSNKGAIPFFTTALQLSLMLLTCFVAYASALRTGWYPAFLVSFLPSTLPSSLQATLFAVLRFTVLLTHH